MALLVIAVIVGILGGFLIIGAPAAVITSAIAIVGLPVDLVSLLVLLLIVVLIALAVRELFMELRAKSYLKKKWVSVSVIIGVGLGLFAANQLIALI